jgi:PAS domain S-box-containing protein
MPKRAALNAALLRWVDDRANEGVFITDRDLVVWSWNAWLARMTGQAAGDVIGRPLYSVRPDVLERGLDRYYQSALEGQASMLAHRFHRHVLRIPTAHGDMPQSGRIAPLLDGETVVGTVTVIEDVTERVQSESELRRQIAVAEQAREDAEVALRAKDEFLATLSHELRTPLNAVLGWTNILRSGNIEAAVLDRALGVIERNAKAQARLIDDMLDMARILAGKLRLELSVVDAVPIVTAALDVIRPTADAKRITIRSQMSHGPLLIQADATRLQQVLWNVLSNATKFTPAGGTVTIRVQERDAKCAIEICDTGNGISADFLPHIFDRFRQASTSLSRAEGGLGLGLALVRQLVDMHGGEVRASSEGLGQGACFTITLPLVEVEPASAVRGMSAIQSHVLAGHCVLVVDDDPDWSDALKTAFTTMGADVTTVPTAAAARERILASELPQPTALVLDIGLPHEDGFTLLRQLRALAHPIAAVPAVCVTAYAGPEHQRHAVDAGFNAFRAKPTTPEEVAAAVLSITR